MLQKKKVIPGLLLLVTMLLLPGCGEKKDTLTDGREVYVKEENSGEEEESEEIPQEEQLFLVTGLDTERKKISLKAYNSREEKEYSYTGATNIKDKYGSHITMEQLAAGEMVKVEWEKESVTAIQVSDEVFTYDNVHNFKLDTEAGSITVGKNSYYYDEDIQVFYRNSKISLAEISQWDTLCLKGIDKKVYAIQVTTGHGTLVLQNTETFEGGNITIGNILSMDIEANMRIEVPEGTWLLSVANDGYGGSSEVIVEANCETAINLEELKGEGPKFCNISFSAEPENAAVYLNGKAVDLSQPQQLKYGRYTLSAKAEGYADWQKTLVVNSENANIKIELQTEEEAAEEEEVEEEKEAEESESELEDSVQELIDELKNNTLSTSDLDSATGSTTSSTLNNLLGID